MSSHFKPAEPPMRRHDLIFVNQAAWRSMLATRRDLAANPLVALWADKGWPLVLRRAMPGEGHGVPLGLPLPPSAGKKRLSFLVRPEDVVSAAPPPALQQAARSAPRAWWPTLDGLDDLASRHAAEARVFGSLAWQALTGLDYLTERSDLDLLLQVHRATDLRRLTAGMARIERAAPMRLDGELVRYDGAAVNWREFHAGAQEILVKTASDVALLDARLFLPERIPS
ncbi:malonate decarboxylase holo-[acyl-carrier-protein] synthase [Mesorhizobium sp. ASY16-5R]|uniref:malonate decarboxylase holo-[acyl-carrier-protein] synthase n=1 Tax=Mesorhizobium sp. ASY16-5R TaxID=3445772 RepID=UPI003FA00944